MRGQVLTYDTASARGIISGDDGNRYDFSDREWLRTERMPRVGTQVDFTVSGNIATQIFPLSSGNSLSDVFGGVNKSPIAAGLFALFLGGLGVHKFYLGYNTQGITLLVGTIVSWMLCIIVIGILPLMAINAICLVEAILYITKSEDEFNRIYVQGTKHWF